MTSPRSALNSPRLVPRSPSRLRPLPVQEFALRFQELGGRMSLCPPHLARQESAGRHTSSPTPEKGECCRRLLDRSGAELPRFPLADVAALTIAGDPVPLTISGVTRDRRSASPQRRAGFTDPLVEKRERLGGVLVPVAVKAKPPLPKNLLLAGSPREEVDAITKLTPYVG